MIRYKVDILAALKARGFTTTKIRRDGLIGENALQRIREGLPPSAPVLDTLCRLTGKQPGALLEWIADPIPEDDTPPTP